MFHINNVIKFYRKVFPEKPEDYDFASVGR
jgi:hypothetical protein